MRKIFIVLSSIFLFGCTTSDEYVNNSASISFTKHRESGICFAILHQPYAAGFTEVDCDKIPSHLLPK